MVLLLAKACKIKNFKLSSGPAAENSVLPVAIVFKTKAGRPPKLKIFSRRHKNGKKVYKFLVVKQICAFYRNNKP